MNIVDVFNSFQTQEQAVEYLERVRWKGQPVCPYCESLKVGRHTGGNEQRGVVRWQCRACTRSFAVTVGTIFHGTHIPLRNWYLCIALMLHSKESASAYQIARDLGMRRPTVWSMMHRIRVAMANDQEQSALLHGIVEADETSSGPNGQGRKNQGRENLVPRKPGRSTGKKPVIGEMERGGRAMMRPATPREVGAKGLSKFTEEHIGKAGTLLVTEEHSGYNRVKKTMLHATLHAFEYVNGMPHINSIEGCWGLVKRAWYRSHHYCSEKYIPLLAGA